MVDSTHITDIEAIQQVIMDGGAMDYIDVVDAVKNRFQLNVSSAQVEQVHHELKKETASKQAKTRPGSRISLDLTTNLSDESGQQTAHPPTDQPTDDLVCALNFVKSIGGLEKAKRALKKLESTFLGCD